jgi:hypothetical protein
MTSVLVVDTEVRRGKNAVDGSGIVEVGGALEDVDDEVEVEVEELVELVVDVEELLEVDDPEEGRGVVDVVLGVVLLLVVVVVTCVRQVQ